MEATTTQPMQTIRFREDPQMPPDAFELKRWPEPHAE
jgi:hypothetical protein